MSDLELVPFRGDVLQAVKDDRGVWVAIKPACENLGIKVQSQLTKLKAKPWAVVTMIVTTGSDGKRYEMSCLHLDALPMWLANIDESRVKATVRPKLARYQCEAARVLADHFLRRTKPPEQAPAAPIHQLVHATHGARIGDTPEGREMVLWTCRMVAKATGNSIQSVCGFARRIGNALSHYRIAMCDWPIVKQNLEDLAMGRILLRRPKALAAKPSNARQTALPFGVN